MLGYENERNNGHSNVFSEWDDKGVCRLSDDVGNGIQSIDSTQSHKMTNTERNLNYVYLQIDLKN